MAIGLISILKLVPWVDVISKAPEIADGARKLWRAVAKKTPSAELPTASPQPGFSPEAQSTVKLQAQLAAVEAEVSDLHTQMLESSALIKDLADQNAHLIKRFEVYRIRVLLLAGIMIVVVVVTAITLSITLAR